MSFALTVRQMEGLRRRIMGTYVNSAGNAEQDAFFKYTFQSFMCSSRNTISRHKSTTWEQLSARGPATTAFLFARTIFILFTAPHSSSLTILFNAMQSEWYSFFCADDASNDP